MNICLSSDVHYAWLNEYLDAKPRRVAITSYNIYAGITFANQDTADWGDKYQLHTRQVMDRLVSIEEVRILIGISDYKSCKHKRQCLDCEKQYVKSIIRILNHAEKFYKFDWRISTNMFLKAYLFEYDDKCRCITSGRNLSDSIMTDISIKLSEEESLHIKSHMDNMWAGSLLINNETIASILEQQNISEEGFREIAQDN